MALVKCRECGSEVSSKAKACPKCAAPVLAQTMGCSKPFLIVMTVLMGVAIVPVVSVVFSDIEEAASSQGTATSTPQPNPVPVQSPRKEVISPPNVSTDVVDDAYRLCGSLESTGLTTQCVVKGWGNTVDVTIDTSGAEARKICAGVADKMTKERHNFAGKWKLRIYSPYSGEKPIAVCPLR